MTVGIAMLIVGALVGATVVRRGNGSQRTQRQLESQISELREQAQSYQREVSDHFTETAQLLNQLTSSYRDVHNHLAKGARSLAADSGATQSLKMLPPDESGDKPAASEPLTPPLDYAVRSTDEEPGVLDEEFGLDKVNRDSAAG